MAVIIDPAPDHWIKLGDEAVGRSATVLADNRLHLSQERPDTFPRRLDQKFAVRIKPDILAKKVEAFGNMSDLGLLQRELQTAFAQEDSMIGFTSSSSNSFDLLVTMKSSA